MSRLGWNSGTSELPVAPGVPFCSLLTGAALCYGCVVLPWAHAGGPAHVPLGQQPYHPERTRSCLTQVSLLYGLQLPPRWYSAKQRWSLLPQISSGTSLGPHTPCWTWKSAPSQKPGQVPGSFCVILSLQVFNADMLVIQFLKTFSSPYFHSFVVVRVREVSWHKLLHCVLSQTYFLPPDLVSSCYVTLGKLIHLL